MSTDDRRPHMRRNDVVGRRVPPGALPGASDEFAYSVIETSITGQSGDRRGARRVRTHLREGLVRELRGRPVVDCRIRDLTSRGARLQLDRERPLPRNFLLREAGTLRSFHATLVWQVGRDAGVKLTRIDDPVG